MRDKTLQEAPNPVETNQKLIWSGGASQFLGAREARHLCSREFRITMFKQLVGLLHWESLSKTHFFMCSCNSAKIAGMLAACSGVNAPPAMPGSLSRMNRKCSCWHRPHVTVVFCPPLSIADMSVLATGSPPQ
jgi:hypothetical protein